MEETLNIRLNNFLENAISGIKNEEKSLEVRMELEDHIWTKAEIKMLSGMSEDVALTEVLAAMGDVSELQHQFEMVHQIVYKKASVLYEGSNDICSWLADKISSQFKIPSWSMKDNPEVGDEEMLIIVTKANYFKPCGDESLRYIKNTELKNVRTILIVGVTFSARHASAASYIIRLYQAGILSDDSLVVKILREKNTDIAIGSLMVCRNMFLLGRIGTWELARFMTNLEKELAKGGRINDK